MYIDEERYKISKKSHWSKLIVIVNPLTSIFEVFLGQRMVKVALTDKLSDKPLMERSYVPCPHCHSLNDSRIYCKSYSLWNWFGLYCPECSGIIPCHLSLTTRTLVMISAPLWWWFRKSIYAHWFRMQQARYKDIYRKPLEKYEQKTWQHTAVTFGLGIFVVNLLLLIYIIGSFPPLVLLLTMLVLSPLAGLAFGYSMHRVVSAKGEGEDKNSILSDEFIPAKPEVLPREPDGRAEFEG